MWKRRAAVESEQGSMILDAVIGIAISLLVTSISTGQIGQYRAHSFEQAAAADARGLAVVMDALFTDTGGVYPSALDDDALATMEFHLSADDSVGAYDFDGDSFVVCIQHGTGSSTDAWAVFDSAEGAVTGQGRLGGCDDKDLDAGDTPVGGSTQPTTPTVPETPTTPSVALPVSDTFSGSGALGTTETGGLAWETLNSTDDKWARSSSQARTGTSWSTNPMAVVDVKTADVSVTESMLTDYGSAGNAIYFRVADATNWLRLRVEWEQRTTTEPGYTCQFEQVTGGIKTYSGFYAPTAAEAEGTYGAIRGSCYPDGSYGAYTPFTKFYRLTLDKSVDGTITAVKSVPLTATAFSTIRVVAKGSDISAYYGSSASSLASAFTASESAHQNATRHGIGYAKPSQGTQFGIPDITIDAS